MADLYPTRTRLALLREVRDGRVHIDLTADDETFLWFPYAPTQWQDRTVVTARVQEQLNAGWLQLDEDRWELDLTNEGRAVLAAKDGV